MSKTSKRKKEQKHGITLNQKIVSFSKVSRIII